MEALEDRFICYSAQERESPCYHSPLSRILVDADESLKKPPSELSHSISDAVLQNRQPISLKGDCLPKHRHQHASTATSKENSPAALRNIPYKFPSFHFLLQSGLFPVLPRRHLRRRRPGFRRIVTPCLHPPHGLLQVRCAVETVEECTEVVDGLEAVHDGRPAIPQQLDCAV